MASPSTVITRGYGSWGSVNLLPTLGYGISDTTSFGIEFSLGEDMQLDFSLPQLPEFSETDSTPDFSL